METLPHRPEAVVRSLRVVAIVMAVAAVAFVSVMPQAANDFWLQVKVGELIAKDHSIPKTVLFAFTEARDNTFNAHEWLPSLLFYWLVEGVGERALPLVLGLSGILLFGLTARLAYLRSEGNVPVALLFGLVAVIVENQRHYLRPELVSLVLMVVYWYLLERSRTAPTMQRWFAAWLIVILWANSHGSFILAPIMAMLYAMGSYIDQRFGAARFDTKNEAGPLAFTWFSIASLAGTVINPVGSDLLAFVFNFGHADSTKNIVGEWIPTFDPIWRDNRGFWIGMVCAAMTAVAMIAGWRRLRATDVLMCLFFMALATQAIRFLVYLGIVAAYLVPGVLPPRWKADATQKRLYALLVVVGAAVLGISSQFGNAQGAFPHTALNVTHSLSGAMVQELNSPELAGNVLNSYELGAEIVYRFYPRLKPEIDSRIDSYGPEWMSLHSSLFFDDELLLGFVQHYDVRYMLLTHNDFLLLQKLPSWKRRQWAVRLLDQTTVLLQRADIPLIQHKG